MPDRPFGRADLAGSSADVFTDAPASSGTDSLAAAARADGFAAVLVEAVDAGLPEPLAGVVIKAASFGGVAALVEAREALSGFVQSADTPVGRVCDKAQAALNAIRAELG